MSSVNVGVDVSDGMRAGLSKYFLSFTAVGFVLPLYLLLLSGFPFFDAVKVVSVVLIQIAAGASIWLNIMHPRSVAAVESVGMGLALGSIFGVVGHQLFLFTPIRSYGWLLPIVVALVVHFFSRKNQITRESFADSELSSLFFVALAVVLILTQWWWLLPLALPTGLALYLLSDTGQRKLASQGRTLWVLIALLFIAATFTMLYLRQLNLDWWIRSWDVTMFETKSYSIATLGSGGNLSLAGYPMNYHWFAIAWLGSLTVVCDLAPWLSIAQVAPAYSTVAIGCLILAISKRTSPNWITKFAILFVFSFATSAYSPANPPNIISLVWIFAGFVIADEYFSKRQNKMFATFGVVAISAFSGKVSAGFTLLGAFALTDLWLAIKDKPKLFGATIRTIILATATVAAFYIVIGGPNRLGNNTFKIGFRWFSSLFGVDSGRNSIVYIAGWIGSFLLLLPLAFAAFNKIRFKSSDNPLILFAFFGFIAGLIPCFTLVDDGMAYFLVTTRVFAAVGLGTTLVMLVAENSLQWMSKKRVIFVLTVSILIGYGYQKVMSLNWREIVQLRGGPTIFLVLIILVYYMIVLLLLVIYDKKSHVVGLRRLALVRTTQLCLLLLLNTVSYAFFSHIKSLPESAASKVVNPAYVGSSALQDGATWLATNSKEESMVGTNKFCVEDTLQFCIDPKFFGVSAMTRMQLFIEGPSRSVGLGGDDETLYPAWAKERLDLSRGFADNPNAEITAKLREYGVDWFYLFKENTTNRNWEPYGTVKYENTEVAIIQLNDK
jgi:hypothetical protein